MQVIKRFIMHAKKTAFIVEHDFIMAAYLADRVIVYEGIPSKDAVARQPTTLMTGVKLLTASQYAYDAMCKSEAQALQCHLKSCVTHTHRGHIAGFPWKSPVPWTSLTHACWCVPPHRPPYIPLCLALELRQHASDQQPRCFW